MTEKLLRCTEELLVTNSILKALKFSSLRTIQKKTQTKGGHKILTSKSVTYKRDNSNLRSIYESLINQIL